MERGSNRPAGIAMSKQAAVGTDVVAGPKSQSSQPERSRELSPGRERIGGASGRCRAVVVIGETRIRRAARQRAEDCECEELSRRQIIEGEAGETG